MSNIKLVSSTNTIFHNINTAIDYIETKLPFDEVWTMLVKQKKLGSFTIRVRVMIGEVGYEYHFETFKTEFLFAINPSNKKLDDFIKHVIKGVNDGERERKDQSEVQPKGKG